MGKRKPPVQVDQEDYMYVVREIEDEWVVMVDIAEFLDVTEATARRKLDGLVAQGKLRVKSGRHRAYALADVCT